jgi:membrane protease YdiL (CAAX protease family)
MPRDTYPTAPAIAGRHASDGALSLLAAAAATAAVVGALAGPAPVLRFLLAAPLLEELVFRAGLQEALLRRSAGRSDSAALAVNALTALAFAAAHAARQPAATAALTFLPALLIGALYQQQRRVLPCIAVHALFNAVWLLWV